MMRVVIIITLITAGSYVAIGKQPSPADFSRYDVILSRKPFGAESVSGAVDAQPEVKPVVNPEESFIKDYRMCAIRDSMAGVSVGLVNVKAKPVMSFFLYEGEEMEGVQLVKADFTEERALLRKDGDEQWISMNGFVRSAMAPAQPAAGGRYSDRLDLRSAQQQVASRLRHRSPIRRVKVPTVEDYNKRYSEGTLPPQYSSTKGLSSLRFGSSVNNRNLSPEEREAKVRKYNMDLIRARGEKGLPLPIVLTPEEDAQLVDEGVLPSQ